MSIELDGNGNSVRSSPVVADLDLARQIRSTGRDDLINQVELLRDRLMASMNELAVQAKSFAIQNGEKGDPYAECAQSASATSYRHSRLVIEEKFNQLLNKFKD